jgi:uncharacterized membrane protein HdeD (DUF308 family)
MASVKQAIVDDAHRLGWWVGLRGLVTLAFGIFFVARPNRGVDILVAAFAVYCFADGFLAIGAAINGGTLRNRGALALEGVLSIAAAVLAYAVPGTIAVVVLFIIAARALILGVLQVIGAIRLGSALSSPLVLALAGLTSMIFGILLMRNPAQGLVTVAWLVGAYGVVLGATEILAALALRGAVEQRPPLRPMAHG